MDILENDRRKVLILLNFRVTNELLGQKPAVLAAEPGFFEFPNLAFHRAKAGPTHQMIDSCLKTTV
jgi:hypothetical protein